LSKKAKDKIQKNKFFDRSSKRAKDRAFSAKAHRMLTVGKGPWLG